MVSRSNASRIRARRQWPGILMNSGYFQIRSISIFGGQLEFHWSVLAGSGLLYLITFSNPLYAAIVVLCYLALILLHEAGHAFVAHRAGCEVYAVRIGIVHGQCEFEDAFDEMTDAKVAWGGVLAQVAFALPLIVVDLVLGNPEWTLWRPVAGILGYWSMFWAAFNLLPIPGLDGEKAWRIVPYFRRS